MGIDRIGKGGAAPPTPDAGGVSGPSETGATGKTFEVDRAKGAAAVGETQASDPTSPLGRLRAGEIDVKGYVDLEVDAATRGLEGLPPGDLAEIKKVLRDQMMTDPGLSDLLRQATGQTPPTPED
jgi:hypothetical protein